MRNNCLVFFYLMKQGIENEKEFYEEHTTRFSVKLNANRRIGLQYLILNMIWCDFYTCSLFSSDPTIFNKLIPGLVLLTIDVIENLYVPVPLEHFVIQIPDDDVLYIQAIRAVWLCSTYAYMYT